MKPERSPSINFRQAMGILLLLWSCLLGFSVIISFVVNAVRTTLILGALKTPEMIGAVLGLIIGIFIFVYITVGFFAISICLIKDPKGYDWKELRKVKM